jgi:hypothetical protein
LGAPSLPPKKRGTEKSNRSFRVEEEMDHQATLSSPLGVMAGRAPANEEELRAMRAAVWHKQRILVVPLEEIIDHRTRDMLNNLARKLYGG